MLINLFDVDSREEKKAGIYASHCSVHNANWKTSDQ